MSKKEPLMSHDPLADLGIEETPTSVDADVQNKGDPDSALQFAASLTIGDVGDFYEVCHQALDDSGPFILDAEAVEVIDGAGIQMIAACVKEAIEQGREVRWQSTSEALVRAARIMGVDESLSLNTSA